MLPVIVWICNCLKKKVLGKGGKIADPGDNSYLCTLYLHCVHYRYYNYIEMIFSSISFSSGTRIICNEPQPGAPKEL